VAGLAIAVALLISSGNERPELLALLVCLAVLSDIYPIEARDLRISGAGSAMVLAMALLGPGAAVVVSVASVVADAIRANPPKRRLLNNLCAYVTFPLVGGIAFEVLGFGTVPDADTIWFAAAVVAIFLATNFLNFLLIVWPLSFEAGESIAPKIRSMYGPVLTVQFAAALLTAVVAHAYQRFGIEVLLLLAVVGFVFIYLLRVNFQAQERGEQLQIRTQELASLQVGLLSTVLKTLALRDKMTARHSAAVARYSRAVAREIGLSEREQELIHTAGLLHDIGKFIFPDSILLANTRLTDDQYELVKKHPEQGAKLVGSIEGYGPVAEIVLAHHERIDGRGYPYGIVGEDIPIGSRIISIADTYDVMTSRDSYRNTVSRAEAIAELRRVADAQLDARLVEIFIDLVERNVVGFRHNDNADFERELNLQKRVRDYAEPRTQVAA
jgi:putative nucleotidyltransferase with HDIG domain